MDTNLLIYILLIVIVVISLAFFITTLAVVHYKNNIYATRVKNESTTTRIFIIDVKKNKVTYFNKSNIRNKRVTDLSDFYNKFHPNDAEKVKNWIYSICVDSKKVEQYLEADIVVNRGRNSFFSLLKLIKYDAKVGLIHLESHLLKFITPNNFSSKKKRGNPSGVVKRSVVYNAIKKTKSLRGFTFAIRFFHIKQQTLSNEKMEKLMMMTLRNEIFPFCSYDKTPRQILDVSDNEMLLFDLRIESREEALQLASSISRALKRCIGVNGYFEAITFSIGVVENAQYYQDFDSIVVKAQEASIHAQQNGKDFYLYQKRVGQIMEINKYSQHVDNLMKDGNLRFLFRPIIDVARKRILGYFEYVKGYNTPFSSFPEMSKYAAKVGKNRELFATVAKRIVPKFSNEKPSAECKLFFLVSLVDIDHISEILSQIPATHKIKMVLVFNEQEVNENCNQLDLFIDTMNKLHSDSFEVALLLQDKNLLLDTSVYTSFDYFVAGAAMMGEIKKNSRIRLSIYGLIEQLLKYNKPIIATDLEGWQSIELIIKSGITKISSEAISASNDMLLPVDAKKLDKLAAMNGNFRQR